MKIWNINSQGNTQVWFDFMCSECGQEVEGEDLFCRRCGHALKQIPKKVAMDEVCAVLTEHWRNKEEDNCQLNGSGD